MTNSPLPQKSNNSCLLSILNHHSPLKELMQHQIVEALPKHLAPDRMLRIALTEMRKLELFLRAKRKQDDKTQIDEKSFLGAIIQCAQLGLEPGDQLGYIYLIPFKNNKINKYECQVIIGYRGLLLLARRSGQISSIQAHCIYANDEFSFAYGLNEHLDHIPTQKNKGELIGVYGIAKMKDGAHQMEIMFKEEIDKIRSTSKSAHSSYSPWTTDYSEMARKTVIRRLAKYLPCSTQMQHAVIVDEEGDLGKQKLASNWDMLNFSPDEPFSAEDDEIISTPPQSKKILASLKPKKSKENNNPLPKKNKADAIAEADAAFNREIWDETEEAKY